MNKTVVVGVAACWLVGLVFLFQMDGVRPFLSRVVDVDIEPLVKFIGIIFLISLLFAFRWRLLRKLAGFALLMLSVPLVSSLESPFDSVPERVPERARGGNWTAPRTLDGDTIHHEGRRIRLSGIDAPERDQPYGSEATRALARQLRRGRVTCRFHGQGSYRRHLGTCYVQGQNVNEWMVRNGYAWSYGRYRRQEELARRERKGVHRSRSAIRPEQWRRRRG